MPLYLHAAGRLGLYVFIIIFSLSPATCTTKPPALQAVLLACMQVDAAARGCDGRGQRQKPASSELVNLYCSSTRCKLL